MSGGAARRAAAASLLAGLLVGLPSLLARLGGWPLPRQVPDGAALDRLLTGRVEVDAAKVIAVVAWTAVLPLLVGLAVELVSCVRGIPAPRLPVIGPIQPLLARLVATAVLTTAPSIQRPALAEVPPPATVVADVAQVGSLGPAGSEAGAVSAPAHARPREDRPRYRVKRFDTFIGIADDLLPGGASRWPELLELNRGMVQPSGRPLLQPEDLEEGALIALTEDAVVGTGRGAAAPAVGEGSAAGASVEWARYVVRRGDWLSTVIWRQVPGASIERVREIVDAAEAANLGSPQPYGGVFEDADSIFPGWSVLIPVNPSPELGAPVPLPRPEGVEEPDRAGVVDRVGVAGDGTVSPTTTSTTTPLPEAPSPAPEAHGNGHRHEPERPGGGAIRLPAGSAVGLVLALGIAGLLARSVTHRRRAYRPSDPAAARAVGEDYGSAGASRELARAARRQIEAAPAPDASQDLGWPDIDPTALGTLWLEGEGAEAAVRGLVARTLVAPGRPSTRVLVDAATSAALLEVEQPVPGLEVLPTAHDILREVDVERVRRTRLLDEAGAPDLLTYRREPVDEALGPVLAVAMPTESEARRWAETQAASRLGVGALLIAGGGRRPAGSRAAAVGPDGRVAWLEGDAPLAEGALGDHVTPEDLAALLAAVADERRLREKPEPLALPSEPFPVEELEATAEASAPTAADPGPEGPPTSGAHATVRLLGPFALWVCGQPVAAGLLDKARELLAYLALHPDGSRRERILEVLWGDVDPVRRQDRFSAAVSNLRGRIRAVLEDPDLDVVQKHGDGYCLDRGLLDVDVWRFHGALAGARGADDQDAKADALRAALAAYGGEFVQESPWEWVEAERENLRRAALDAAVQLAELERAGGRLDEAVSVVEKAIEIDPYAEYLYVRGVKLLASAGRIESARALYKALVARLEDIDAEPMPETIEAVGAVLAARARETLNRI